MENLPMLLNRFVLQLQNIGMITDALWSDFDKDGKIDLVLTGEWMPVTFLKNTGIHLYLSIKQVVLANIWLVE